MKTTILRKDLRDICRYGRLLFGELFPNGMKVTRTNLKKALKVYKQSKFWEEDMRSRHYNWWYFLDSILYLILEGEYEELMKKYYKYQFSYSHPEKYTPEVALKKFWEVLEK